MSDPRDDYTNYSNNFRARIARLFNKKAYQPTYNPIDTDVLKILFYIFVIIFAIGFAIKRNAGRDVDMTCGATYRLRSPGAFENDWIVEEFWMYDGDSGWRKQQSFRDGKRARAYCRRLQGKE